MKTTHTLYRGHTIKTVQDCETWTVTYWRIGHAAGRYTMQLGDTPAEARRLVRLVIDADLTGRVSLRHQPGVVAGG